MGWPPMLGFQACSAGLDRDLLTGILRAANTLLCLDAGDAGSRSQRLGAKEAEAEGTDHSVISKEMGLEVGASQGNIFLVLLLSSFKLRFWQKRPVGKKKCRNQARWYTSVILVLRRQWHHEFKDILAHGQPGLQETLTQNNKKKCKRKWP